MTRIHMFLGNRVRRTESTVVSGSTGQTAAVKAAVGKAPVDTMAEETAAQDTDQVAAHEVVRKPAECRLQNAVDSNSTTRMFAAIQAAIEKAIGQNDRCRSIYSGGG